MTSAPKVLTPLYYQRLYDIEQAHGWSRSMRELAGVLLDPIARTRRRWRILDVGCGTGAMLDWLQRFPGAEIVGLDVSSDALGFCRTRGHRALVEGSALDLPFPDGSFDLIICTDVLQHLPNPPGDRAALREAHRVLDDGGYIYVRTNSRFGIGSPTGAERENYRRYGLSELRASFEEAGFVVQRATYANCLPSLLALARDRLTGRLQQMREHDLGLRLQLRPPALRWIDSLLAGILHFEARYVKRPGRTLPFGHSLVALSQKPDRVRLSNRLDGVVGRV